VVTQLVGINILFMINKHSSVALQYGIDKDFLNEYSGAF